MQVSRSFVFIALLLFLAGTSSLSIASTTTTFTATDLSATSNGAPHPNGDAEYAIFAAAAAALGGTLYQQNFEGETVQNTYINPISLSDGITINTSGNIDTGVRSGGDPRTGIVDNQTGAWNTTASGKNYFRMATTTASLGTKLTASTTFSFGTSVNAFSLYISGLGTDLDSLIISFTDGSSFQIPGNATFGDVFFGLTDSGSSFDSVTITEKWTATGGDLHYAVGLDDLSYAPVPEPSSLILLGSGLAGFAGVLRRRLPGR